MELKRLINGLKIGREKAIMELSILFLSSIFIQFNIF